MTMEADLAALLKTQCTRVYPDVAPNGTARPYVVWQALGGESFGFLDNTPGDKRNTLMQIAVYADTRAAALQLVRQIEDALRAATAFVCRPMGEPASTYEPIGPVYGSVQRFEIWSAR